MLFYLAICLLSQTRYIFAHAQMRYNLPCGRLRYDINPFTPERVYRIEDISHAARVYRKSRKGFISLRSVLKGTTLKLSDFFIQAAGLAWNQRAKRVAWHCGSAAHGISRRLYFPSPFGLDSVQPLGLIPYRLRRIPYARYASNSMHALGVIKCDEQKAARFACRFPCFFEKHLAFLAVW